MNFETLLKGVRENGTEYDIDKELQSLTNDVTVVNSRIEKVEIDVVKAFAFGGNIQAHDFKLPAPPQNIFIEYSARQVWGEGGQFLYNPIDRKLSTYKINGVTHELSEIFNATRVNNLYNCDTWELVNTPNTVPPQYEWIDIGAEKITPASEQVSGTVKLYKTLGDAEDGAISQKGVSESLISLKAQIDENVLVQLEKQNKEIVQIRQVTEGVTVLWEQ